MKEYVITHVTDKVDWNTVPVIEIDEIYSVKAEGVTAKAQIAYNDEALLVHLSTKENNYRRVENGPLGSPCEDSCLEFFFSPIENDKRYFNVEFNVNGCMYLGMGSSVNDLTRLIFAGDELFHPEINALDDGWEICYSIPYSFIRRFFKEFKAEKGASIRANCYKCSDKGEHPHYMTWCPIVKLPRSSFHNPDCFGKMIFG
jgi:hypothetical protein